MNKTGYQIEEITEFLVKVTETQEYKDIEYLVFSIRELYLNYLSDRRINKLQIPNYLQPLVDVVIGLFNTMGISTVDMLHYMLDNDVNNWVHYYATVFIIPCASGKHIEAVDDLNDLFALVMTGYILDIFRSNKKDIRNIVVNEIIIHEKNKYGLSVVAGVEFKNDYFVFEDKAYLYNILTNTIPISFGDSMPGFARIITDQIKNGDVLLRLDERLALPVGNAISYSKLTFDKYRGPQFKFKDTLLVNQKTITVHMDNKTYDKLMLVVKKRHDEQSEKDFWHVELETLPYMDKESQSDYCITTFLHGMYFPEDDTFTHIDCTKNQYNKAKYIKKYSDSSEDTPIDTYTDCDKLHYKIWCVEGGEYSRKTWYDLMVVSLSKKYSDLLNEMIG